MLGFDLHVERMRFFDLGAADEIVVARRERERVDAPTESRELNPQIHFGGRERLPGAERIDAKFRRHAALEDRDLDSEFIIREQAAAGGESLSAEQPLKKAGSAKKKIDKALMGFMSNLAFKVWRS
jgi:hypothetical protein